MRSGSRQDVSCGGHTLLELLAVLAIAAVAAALAAPSVAALGAGQSAERAAVSLLMDLRLAQWRAICSGRRVRFVPGVEPTGVWSYRLEREQGPDSWAVDGAARRLPRGVALHAAGAPAKLFNPDGTSSTGSITLATPAGGLYRYTLTPATGRVRFYRGGQEAAREP